MEWEEKKEDLERRNGTERINARIGLLRIYLWRQAIEDDLARLLRAANIEPTDLLTIRKRCRCENAPVPNGAEERYFMDGSLVLVTNYRQDNNHLIFNIVAPITEEMP